MEKTLLMAVDLGTSFIKAGVYDAGSACVAQASEPVKDYRPGPGIFIQKGQELLDSVVACIKSVTGQLGDRSDWVEAIAFTGQMSGFMGVDRDWNDITTWSCSLDTRYMPYAERQMRELRELFLKESCTSLPQMAPKFEWFKKEFPEASRKIRKYLIVSGYVIGRLGNLPIEEAVMDRSYSAWTGLADVQNDCWSKEICEAIGLEESYLPRIVNSNYICGRLSVQAARETGLRAGIPLVSGAGDKIAGCLGCAAVTPGDMVFEASSYGEVSCCIETCRPDLEEGRLDILASAIPGEFYATHFAAGSGITLDWFVNTFSRMPEENLSEAFRRIESAAAAIPPGCSGLFGMGLLGGSSMPSDGALKGAWLGFEWSHKKEHFYRALLESFTYDFTLAMERMALIYPEYSQSTVKIIGGGAKSVVWPQMCADVAGKRYETINRKDAAMWGASILAGNAIGLFPDMKKTALEHIAVTNTFVPEPERTALYKPYLKLYRDYLVVLHDIFDRIAKLQEGCIS